MSGGHFNYEQYHIGTIADKLAQDINEYGDLLHPATIAEMQDGLRALRIAAVYAQRIDWMLSGDDGELSFLTRLRQELETVQRDTPAAVREDHILSQGRLNDLPEGITIRHAGGTAPYVVSGDVDGMFFRLTITNHDWTFIVAHTDGRNPEPVWSQTDLTSDRSFASGYSCTNDLYASELLYQQIHRYRRRPV